jgi:hypothetical protein
MTADRLSLNGRRSAALGAAAVTLTSALCLAACSTTSSGMGGGDITRPRRHNQPVLFSWQSDDGGLSGQLSATGPKKTFTGRFLEITIETTRASLTPFWGEWNEGWGDWPSGGGPWDATYDWQRFDRLYTGKVIANLRSADGASMRCRFTLQEPARGMPGGARGECQLVGGEVLNAVIDRR